MHLSPFGRNKGEDIIKWQHQDLWNVPPAPTNFSRDRIASKCRDKNGPQVNIHDLMQNLAIKLDKVQNHAAQVHNDDLVDAQDHGELHDDADLTLPQFTQFSFTTVLFPPKLSLLNIFTPPTV